MERTRRPALLVISYLINPKPISHMTPRFPATAVRLQPLPALLNASREARLGHSSRPHLGLTTLPLSSPLPSCQLPTPRPKTCQSPKPAHNQTRSTPTQPRLDSRLNKPSPQPDLGPLHSGASPRLAAHRDLSPPPRHTHIRFPSPVCVLVHTHTVHLAAPRASALPHPSVRSWRRRKGGETYTSHGLFLLLCFALLWWWWSKQQTTACRKTEDRKRRLGGPSRLPACLPAAGPANA